MPKKSSKRAPVAATNPETAYFTKEDSTWVEDWVGAILSSPATRPIALSRLTSLLTGKSINNVPAKHSSQNAKDLFRDLISELQFKATAESIGAVDIFWHALLDYSKKHSSAHDTTETIYYWSENKLIEPAKDAETPMRSEAGTVSDKIDESYITTSLALARLFSLGYGYSTFAWNALQDGLDVGGEDVTSDSMRVASCAQLLGGGNRIRKWIGGGGQEGTYEGFSETWLGKSDDPIGEAKWDSFVEALEKESKNTKSDWVKSVITATQEHIEYSRGDLTSDQVYAILYPKKQEAHHYEDGVSTAEADAAAADGGE